MLKLTNCFQTVPNALKLDKNVFDSQKWYVLNMDVVRSVQIDNYTNIDQINFNAAGLCLDDFI